jgi:hypothetical protein
MSTPYYLAFTDEAQAQSVLYTYHPATYELDADGKPTDVVITEEYWTPNYANISTLGTVYEPAPVPLPDPYVPVPYPAPNYGVNVLVIDGEDATPIKPYAVMPSPFPQRVWAI